MKQRDIYLARLEPVVGGEQGGTRPVVIISGDAMNNNLPMAIVCPVTSKIKNYSGCVPLKKTRTNKLKTDGEIISFQIRAISKKRLVKKLGYISDEELNGVIKGLNQTLYY